MISLLFIQVLNSFEFSEPTTVSKKKSLNETSHGRASKRASKRDSDSSEVEEEEEEVETKKKVTSRGKMQNSEGLKKRKRAGTETKTSSKKQSMASKRVSADNSDAEDSGIVSEDGHSHSSAEKSVKVVDLVFCPFFDM